MLYDVPLPFPLTPQELYVKIRKGTSKEDFYSLVMRVKALKSFHEQARGIHQLCQEAGDYNVSAPAC